MQKRKIAMPRRRTVLKLLAGSIAGAGLSGTAPRFAAAAEPVAQVGKQVCDAAAQGPRPAGPTLSDALGTTPMVPDSSTATKKGQGTFDTLTGSPLAR